MLPQDTTHCVSLTHILDTIKSKRESDQAATTFITPYGPFCFNTVPFGLKNAGATYQRMIQTCLEKQIGKTVEAYVDDVVIKTRHVETLIDGLHLTFDNLRVYDIKLNPEKCVFGVPAGKLLGFTFPTEELKQIQPKSELCHNWLRQQTLNKSKSSQVAWQL